MMSSPIRFLTTAMATLALVTGVTAGPPKDTGSEDSTESTPQLTLPTNYDDHRFFATPITTNGTKMNFLTSTGGESLIYSDWARELNVPILSDSGSAAVMLPALDPKQEIPQPRGNRGQIPIVSTRYRRPYFTSDNWGILGQSWFAERVWTLDYPGRKMLLRPIGDLPDVAEKHRSHLGFRVDDIVRQRQSNLPSIRIVIAGEPLAMLLDTGASVVVSETLVKSLNDKRPSVRSMSLIGQTQFDTWKAKHKWRVVEGAEKGGGAAMIEVPSVTIGGFEVGPVWFMARPDPYFRARVSKPLDRTVAGSLGGNALRFFRVTLDFPGSVALFEKP